MRTVEINCLSEAVGPLAHLSGSAGNEGIVAREPVHTDRGVMLVPYLSGNAIRHRMIRRPMALWLIDRYGLKGRLTIAQLNFLVHGGNLTQSTASESTKRIAECHEYWPLLRLCGGSLPDQILSGSLDVWRGTLVCEENRDSLSKILSGLPEQRMKSFEQFLMGYQYTRGDAGKLGLSRERTDVVEDSSLMIYSGQAVARGALFHHGFVLKHIDTVELGCLLLAMRLWRQDGATIGGNSRLGHGRLDTVLIDHHDDGEAVAAYVEHVDNVREQAIGWLEDCFAKADAAKEKKAARQKAKGK